MRQESRPVQQPADQDEARVLAAKSTDEQDSTSGSAPGCTHSNGEDHIATMDLSDAPTQSNSADVVSGVKAMLEQ